MTDIGDNALACRMEGRRGDSTNDVDDSVVLGLTRERERERMVVFLFVVIVDVVARIHALVAAIL